LSQVNQSYIIWQKGDYDVFPSPPKMSAYGTVQGHILRCAKLSLVILHAEAFQQSNAWSV